MNGAITIVVNGDQRELQADTTLLDLLSGLDLDPRAVVVELNRTIVRRPELGDTTLTDGDRVELVHFVGGG
ncbi:MAG: sulfur carrier protein ThiS [Gemmatimonadales bacterium]|jgi:thiamine biosynthesis protein ThiS